MVESKLKRSCYGKLMYSAQIWWYRWIQERKHLMFMFITIIAWSFCHRNGDVHNNNLSWTVPPEYLCHLADFRSNVPLRTRQEMWEKNKLIPVCDTNRFHSEHISGKFIHNSGDNSRFSEQKKRNSVEKERTKNI